MASWVAKINIAEITSVIPSVALSWRGCVFIYADYGIWHKKESTHT